MVTPGLSREWTWFDDGVVCWLQGELKENLHVTILEMGRVPDDAVRAALLDPRFRELVREKAQGVRWVLQDGRYRHPDAPGMRLYSWGGCWWSGPEQGGSSSTVHNTLAEAKAAALFDVWEIQEVCDGTWLGHPSGAHILVNNYDAARAANSRGLVAALMATALREWRAKEKA